MPNPFYPQSHQTSENLPIFSIQSPIKAIITTVTAHTTQPSFDLPAPPAFYRIAVGILGILITLSALPWMYFSLSKFGGFAWGLFGFEFLTALAGIYAILLGLGKFKDGWAIGVTAIAGSILVALVFGLYIDFWMAKKIDFPDIYPLAKYTLTGRAISIVALFALASLAVFSRNKKSITYIIKSALCATPIVIVAALIHYDLGPGAWINTTLGTSTGTGALQAVLTITPGLFFIILFSVAGHLLIRAYECGRPASAQSE